MLAHGTLLRYCRARDLLQNTSPTLSLSIDDIARDAAVSPYHFIRQFHALFGETPHQYRMRSRLDLAKRLLASGEASVTEACMATGFSSLGSFSHLFTRRFGETPSFYRKRWIAVCGKPGTFDAYFTPACMSLMLAALSQSQFSRSTAKPTV